MVQFEGIFESILHPTQPANQQNKQNIPKAPTKFSFEIIEEDKKNQPPQPENQNKKPQLKSGIKLVIESDKKYELLFLEIETATEFHSVQVYPNIFIPNQSGANIRPEDELICAVLLKLHTYERNKEWIGLNEYKNHRKR